MGKKIIAAILCLLAVLPLAACGMVGDDTADIAPEPMMDVADLDKLAAAERKFPNRTAAESAEIWEWAHKVVADWNERYQALLKDMETETVYKPYKKDESEYSRTILVGRNYQQVLKGKGTNRATRTLATVKGWAESDWAKTRYERTEYGGFKDESAKQEATGFYYAKKVNGRWFFIDPLGYPAVMGAVQFVTPSFSGNYQQKEWVDREFGTNEKWAIATTLKLKNDHGVYGTSHIDPSDYLYQVPGGLSNIAWTGPGIHDYCDELGICWIAGSTYFDPYAHEKKAAGDKAGCNQVMPVFNRDYIDWLEEAAKTDLAPYANEDRIVGWCIGNELPIKPDMLDRYLEFSDPNYLAKNFAGNARNELYYETYAVTVTWLRFMTGKEIATKKDITDDLRSLFIGFIYDHMYAVTKPVYDKYVPNHLFMGVRWLTNGEVIVEGEANTILAREWAARFTARYCDVMCINWYVIYYADPDTYAKFTTWTQDKPILITEWAFWTEENTGYNCVNTSRQGCVKTRDERAACFEHLALEWLDWTTVIGWSWYRYNHETKENKVQDVPRGLLNDNGEYDPYFQASMDKINNMAYNIARYLYERKYK